MTVFTTKTMKTSLLSFLECPKKHPEVTSIYDLDYEELPMPELNVNEIELNEITKFYGLEDGLTRLNFFSLLYSAAVVVEDIPELGREFVQSYIDFTQDETISIQENFDQFINETYGVIMNCLSTLLDDPIFRHFG